MSIVGTIMKMGNMKDLGDVANKLQALTGAPKSGDSGKAAELDKQTAELALYVRTLVEILQSKGGFTEDEFKAKFKELDLEDGVEDGR